MLVVPAIIRPITTAVIRSGHDDAVCAVAVPDVARRRTDAGSDTWLTVSEPKKQS